MAEKDLEKRIQELEDREAIKEVVARYCYYVDKKKLEELMALFHDKVELNAGSLGSYHGKAEVRKFYGEIVPQALSDAWHLVHNQLIELKGSEATSSSYFEVTGIRKGEAIIGAGTYEDRLVKEGSRWQIITRVINIDYMVPLKEGWGERKVAL